MKKIIYSMRAAVVAALMFVGITTHAQTHYDANIAVGVKGGVTLSRMFFNPSVRQQMPLGTTAGLTFRYTEENHFGIIGEFNFTQRGWKEDFQEAPYHYRRTLNYLQIPVLAHIYFGRRGRFFFNAGPEIGFLLAESTSANFDPAEMKSLPDFPNTNRMNLQMEMKAQNKVDYGISAGLGGEFNLTQLHALSLELRFYYGLGNIFKSARTDPFHGSNSMSLAATVGYNFRIR